MPIQHKVITVDDAEAGMKEIFDDLQTRHHDDWDWLNAHFYLEVLMTTLRSTPKAACEYCGPACYGGACHNARVEAGDKWGAFPGELAVQDGPADSADQQGNMQGVEPWRELENRINKRIQTLHEISHDGAYPAFCKSCREEMKGLRDALSFMRDVQREFAAPSVPPSRSAPTELPARPKDTFANVSAGRTARVYIAGEAEAYMDALEARLGLSAPLREEDHAVKSKGTI